MTGDSRKQSLYFPAEMLEKIKNEAKRQDRSVSWVMQKAWQVAEETIATYPSVYDESGELLCR